MNCTLKTFMACSLLLNLLLIGFIVGHSGKSLMADHLHTSIAEAARSLPEEKRANFEEIMHRAERDTKPYFEQFEAARARAIAVLKAKKFDAKAFSAQTKQMEQLHAQLKQRTAKAISEAADDLDPNERQLMAELLRRPQTPEEKNCSKAKTDSAH